jgi:hypothetical protein
VAGWIADEKFWNEFIPRWQSVLDAYKVDCFHFTDWAKACYVKNNPDKKHAYEPDGLKHLSSSELDKFFKDLAALLDNPNLQFEISILERKKFFEDKKSPNASHSPSVYAKNPESYLVYDFIERCTRRILQVWQLAGRPVKSVKFVFDERNNVGWRQAIKKELADYEKWEWPLKPVEFKTKKQAIPVQAADMLAYRSHQFTSNMVKGKVLTKPSSILDVIIANRVHPPEKPFAMGKSAIPPIPEEHLYKMLSNCELGLRHYSVDVGLKDKTFYSGTYIKTCGYEGILTAGHCASSFLSKTGFNLGVKDTRHLLVATPSDFEHVAIDYDVTEGYTLDGPDLSFLIIKDKSLIDILRSQNVEFYDLDRQDISVFQSDMARFSWAVSGCAIESVEESKEQINGEEHTLISATSALMQCNLVDFETRGSFDYIKLDALSGQYNFPKDFKGFSGGGIWYLRFVTKDGKVYSIEPILAGVAVWQSTANNGIRRITGHSYNSIYGRVRQVLTGK